MLKMCFSLCSVCLYLMLEFILVPGACHLYILYPGSMEAGKPLPLSFNGVFLEVQPVWAWRWKDTVDFRL